MFLKLNSTVHKGKKRYYALLVRSVRTPKGPRHEVVKGLGRVSEEEGEKLRWAFSLAEQILRKSKLK